MIADIPRKKRRISDLALQNSLELGGDRQGSGTTILALSRTLVKWPSLVARRVSRCAAAAIYWAQRYLGGLGEIVKELRCSNDGQ